MISDYKLPDRSGWNKSSTPVCLTIPKGYPGTMPYGIYVPSDIRINNEKPNNFQVIASNKPPFDGSWGVLSWQLEPWNPLVDITKGSNLLNFVQSFKERFLQGK